jgi:hypothetical protein
MSNKNTYWVHDGDTYAVVTGATERDRYVGLGWTAVDEPSEGWVHIWREGIELPGRVPIGTLETLWGPGGWVTGPPPDGTSPFTEPPAEPPAESKTEPKSAAGGNPKEK